MRAAPLVDDERSVYIATVGPYLGETLDWKESLPGRVYKFSASGQLLWNFSAPDDPASHSIPTTPVLYKGLLILSTNGAVLDTNKVIALNMSTGEMVWSAAPSRAAGGDAWSLAAGHGLVVAAGTSRAMTSGNRMVFALDAQTGALVWSFKPDLPVYNFLPAIAAVGTTPALIFSDQTGRVYSLDMRNGSIIWKFAVTRVNEMSTGGAALDHQGAMVFVTSNTGRAITSFDSQDWGHGVVRAFNVSNGEVLWEQETFLQANSAPSIGSLHPLGQGPLAVVVPTGRNPAFPPQGAGDLRGRVEAFDAASGRRLSWHHEFLWPHAAAANDSTSPPHPCVPDSFSNAAIGGDGTVYVGAMDGKLYALRDSNGDGSLLPSEIQTLEFGNGFQGSPAIAPGLLVVAPCNGLHVFASCTSPLATCGQSSRLVWQLCGIGAAATFLFFAAVFYIRLRKKPVPSVDSDVTLSLQPC